MRIISGKNRGMTLFSPEGKAVRPTQDMVKEAVFNIIQFETEGCVFLDMFAGTGQMGCEALSRGAAEVWFFEPDAAAFKVLSKNLARINAPDRARPVCGPYMRLAAQHPRPVFDIVYIDPPFAADLYAPALAFLNEGGYLHADSILLAESPVKSPPPERVGGLARTLRRYGQVGVSIYRAGD